MTDGLPLDAEPAQRAAARLIGDAVVAAHDAARDSLDPAISRRWRAIGDGLAQLQQEALAVCGAPK